MSPSWLPLGVTSLQTAASGGVIRGLTDGLISFRDLLKGVASVAAGAARYTWDAKFRDEVQTKGGAMIGPWLDLIFYWGSANRQRAVYMAFMRNGKAIGTIVGEEIGREISDQIAKKSVAEIFEWVGYIIGRVYFEILLLVAFEGFGAAVRAVRSGGEGARIAARLWPRIERLLDGLNDVKNFLRARIAARAAEGGRDVVGLLRPYVNLNRAAETLKFEAPLGAWLDELAQRSQLGAVRRVRGMPEFPGPGGNPDYHLFLRNLDNTELANEALAADLRGDAVIAEGNKIDNIINNAVGSKAGRQADAVFIEIGSKGTSGEITDEAVKAWNVDHVRPMSPSLRRLMVVRNTGGARQILIDLLIR